MERCPFTLSLCEHWSTVEGRCDIKDECPEEVAVAPMRMKIWTHNKFEGHNPVGSAAVVIAEDRASAKLFLDRTLKVMGLKDCDEKDFIEMDSIEGNARILCAGDY